MTRKVVLFVLVILERLLGVMRRLNSGQVVWLLLQRAGRWVTLLLNEKKAKSRIRRRMVVVLVLVAVVLVAVVVVLTVVLLLWTNLHRCSNTRLIRGSESSTAGRAWTGI
jgi:hypothetical protein